MVRRACANYGLDPRSVWVGPPNTALTLPESSASHEADTSSLRVILWRPDDLGFPRSTRQAEPADVVESTSNVQAFLRGLENFAKVRPLDEFLVLECPPIALSACPRPLFPSWTLLQEARLRTEEIMKLASHGLDIRAVSWIELMGLLHVNESLDVRSELLHGQPLSVAAARMIGDFICQRASSPKSGVVKLIVVDGDGTLWGGVLGEDGPDGVQVESGKYPDSGYWYLQRVLKELQRQGLLLALVSKNSPEDIRELFQSRSDMVLSETDFVDVSASWEEKAGVVSRLLSDLQVDARQALFIDDNPAEILKLRARIPDLVTLPLTDPEETAKSLLQLCELVGPQTDEDARRTLFAKQAQERRLRVDSLPPMADADVGKLLNTTVKVERLTSQRVTRVEQLFKRTTQFNTRVESPGRAELLTWLDDDDADVFTAHVSDDFGSSGLSGALVLIVEGGKVVIQHMAVSCRVLGRGVEEAFLSRALDMFSVRGEITLQLRLDVTRRNEPARRFAERQAARGVDVSIRGDLP
jgi:FkbH-like protein